jgi:hypothetical protein
MMKINNLKAKKGGEVKWLFSTISVIGVEKLCQSLWIKGRFLKIQESVQSRRQVITSG